MYACLYPNADDWVDDEDMERVKRLVGKRNQDLLALGLIGSDVAYTTWRKQQDGVDWIWNHAETPGEEARYWTRDLWFWSRHVNEVRAAGLWQPPAVPKEWKVVEAALVSGNPGELNLNDGAGCWVVKKCLRAAGLY